MIFDSSLCAQSILGIWCNPLLIPTQRISKCSKHIIQQRVVCRLVLQHASSLKMGVPKIRFKYLHLQFRHSLPILSVNIQDSSGEEAKEASNLSVKVSSNEKGEPKANKKTRLCFLYAVWIVMYIFGRQIRCISHMFHYSPQKHQVKQ